MGKGYAAADQAGLCLHTIGVLQAYQADLLKELNAGEGVNAEYIKELRKTTDLSLRDTKETARAIGAVYGSSGGGREAFLVDPV